MSKAKYRQALLEKLVKEAQVVPDIPAAVEATAAPSPRAK